MEGTNFYEQDFTSENSSRVFCQFLIFSMVYNIYLTLNHCLLHARVRRSHFKNLMRTTL